MMPDWDGEERRTVPPPHVIYRYVDEHIQAQAETRFRVKTLGDLQALISLAVVMVGGIVWGSRLESKIEDVQKEHGAMQETVAKGILPVTEERLNSLTARLDRREQEAAQAMALIHEVEKECQKALK